MNARALIEKTASRLTYFRRANFSIAAVLPCLLIGSVSLGLSLYDVPQALSFALITLAALVALFLLGRSYYLIKPTTREDAAAFIDGKLQSKERFLTLSTFIKDQSHTVPNGDASTLALQDQSDLLAKEFTPEQEPVFSLAPSARLSVFLSPPLSVLILLALWFQPPSQSLSSTESLKLGAKQAAELRELIAEEPELPEQLQNELGSLADSLEEEGLFSEESLEQVETALDKVADLENRKTQNRLPEDEAREQGQRERDELQDESKLEPLSPEKTPEQERETSPPPPPPPPPGEKEKGEPQMAPKKDGKQPRAGSDQPQGKGDQHQEKESPDGTKPDGEKKGQSKEGKDKEDDPKKNTTGLGEGKQKPGEKERDQKGEGQSQEKRDGDGEGEGKKGSAKDSGKSGENAGKGEGKKQASSIKKGKASNKGDPGKEEKDGKEGKVGGKKGAQKKSGIAKVKKTLEELKEKMEKGDSPDAQSKGKEKSQKGSPSKENSKEKSEDKSQDNSRAKSKPEGAKGKQESQDKKKGAGKKQASDKNKQEETQNKKNKKEAQGDNTTKAPNPLNSNKNDSNQRSKTVAKPSETAKRYGAFDGGKDGKIDLSGVKRDSLKISKEKEKITVRSLGSSDDKRYKNPREAKSQTSLSSEEFLKPEARVSQGKQPIPVEYRDVLR